MWQPSATKPTVLYSASSDVQRHLKRTTSPEELPVLENDGAPLSACATRLKRLRSHTGQCARQYVLDEEILGEMPQPRMGALRVGLSSSRKEALKQTHYEFVVSQREQTPSRMDFAIKKTASKRSFRIKAKSQN